MHDGQLHSLLLQLLLPSRYRDRCRHLAPFLRHIHLGLSSTCCTGMVLQ